MHALSGSDDAAIGDDRGAAGVSLDGVEAARHVQLAMIETPFTVERTSTEFPVNVQLRMIAVPGADTETPTLWYLWRS